MVGLSDSIRASAHELKKLNCTQKSMETKSATTEKARFH
jgi:hypothetical protein